MKKEHENQLSQKMNKYIFHYHRKSPSNYNAQTEIEKIQNHYKMISSNNKAQNILNKNKMNTIINRKKHLNIPKAYDLNLVNTETRKIINLKKNANINGIRVTENNLNDSNRLKQTDIMLDNNIKSYQNTTVNPKNKIIVKNYKKCTLIKINNNKQDYISLNKQKNDISTNYLFKNNQINPLETSNKAYKKSKNLLISYFTKNANNVPTINGKIYNSNNNILNLNKKYINKKNNISNKNNKVFNTSIQLENVFNSSKSNSSIIHKDSTLKNREYKVNNSIIKKGKLKINNIINKFTKVNNSGKIILNNNNNYISTNTNKNNNNNNSPIYYYKYNIKTIDSNSSNRNLTRQLKKRLNIKQSNLINNEISDLKRFNTEKEFELNKKVYPIKKKKKCIDKEVLSINSIKSFELKKNEKLNIDVSNIFYHKRNSHIEKKIEDLEKYIEICEYKISPIRHKIKKSTDMSNDLKIKRKTINRNSNDKTSLNKKNNKNNNCFKKNKKKEKKNLSMQFNNSDNEKNKNNNYNTIENNNNDNYNNEIQTKFRDSSNNNLSRNHKIFSCKNNSNYFRKTNIKINKRKVYNIDFDNMQKDSKKQNSRNKKKLNNKRNSVTKNNKKNDLVKQNNIYKSKTNIKDNNKMKFLKTNDKKKTIYEEIKNNEDEKEILFMSDLFFAEKLDEDYFQEISQSTNNLTKINSKMEYHFMNILEHNSKSKKTTIPKKSISLLSLFKEQKIINKIIDFCCLNSINKLCLISKQYYKYIKPYIYKKIKLKIIQINNNNININNIIKQSIIQYTPLSKLSPAILQKKYIDLLYELNEKYDNEIKKDLLRTSPDNISFQYGNENYNKLYHILSAYANYNKNIGYAQGLNFVAANCIYIYKNEIDAFIFLDALIRKFNLESLFGINNNELNQKLNEIEFTVNKWCPEVNKHLQKIFLNYDFFTCKWMITLFSNDMDIKYLFQLWDYMIIFGWKFFKGFVIGTIKFNEEIILKSTLETITKIMNDILKSKEFENNFNNIINYAFHYINEEDEIL